MITRREFLASVAAGLGALRPAAAWSAGAPRRLPIAFSTLGCPDWSWRTILDYAATYGYSALELRTLRGSEDLARRPEFAPRQLAQRRHELASRHLRVACVDTSARMHEPDAARRAAQMQEARRLVDLARALGAPFVRVFGDEFPEGEPREEVIARVAAGLRELGAYAGRHEVTVLLETHGDFTDSPTLLEVMRQARSPAVGILWDAHHTFVSAGESPETTLRRLGPYIRHTHLKDSVPEGAGRRYVLTGAGDVPVRRQVKLLAESEYQGVYTFEWEKRWHPTLEEPEVAFPHFSRVMQDYLGGVR